MGRQNETSSPHAVANTRTQ